MKHIILSALAACLLTLTSSGQGTVSFNNTGTTLFQYRDFSTGYVPTPVPTGAGMVELLWAPLGTSDLSLFQVLPGVTGVSPITPGRFSGGTRTIPAGSGFTGIAPGDTVSLVIRGWKGPATFWDQAQTSGIDLYGYSDIFTVNTGDPTMIPPQPPGVLTGPGGFTGLVVGVPEPSCLALCGCGAAGLVTMRRRRQHPCNP